eukprot:Gb_00345 [translate_table: standard]
MSILLREMEAQKNSTTKKPARMKELMHPTAIITLFRSVCLVCFTEVRVRHTGKCNHGPQRP